MRAGLWSDVGESLDAAEGVLDMEDMLKINAEEKGKAADKRDQVPAASTTLPSPPSSTKSSRSIFEYALIVHTLILGIIFHTYVGDANLANARLKWLHELLDTHSHRFPQTGIFEVCFSNSSVFFFLTFCRSISQTLLHYTINSHIQG
jgi:hypothetical protein